MTNGTAAMLGVRLEGVTERRRGGKGDYWAAKSPRLGLFAYGDSAAEARDRVLMAAEMAMEHWRKEGLSVGDELARTGVAHGDAPGCGPAPDRIRDGEWSRSHLTARA